MLTAGCEQSLHRQSFRSADEDSWCGIGSLPGPAGTLSPVLNARLPVLALLCVRGQWGPPCIPERGPQGVTTPEDPPLP